MEISKKFNGTTFGGNLKKQQEQIGHLAFVCLLNDVVLFMNHTFRI